LGAVEPVQVDVRVVAATNQNLQQLVQDGAFRQDLYYRVNVVRLQLPPLRDRREDIPLLVDHFVSKFNQLQDRHIGGVSEEVMAVLFKHDFPGNIRELENIIEHAFVLCRGPLIQLQHLPPELYGTFDSSPSGGGGLTLKALEELYITEALRRHNGNRAAAARELGINPSTLFRKIKSLKIETPTSDGGS
jgi:transcriptional regulator with PAS, ATPase and Fis domain